MGLRLSVGFEFAVGDKAVQHTQNPGKKQSETIGQEHFRLKTGGIWEISDIEIIKFKRVT